MDKKTTKNSKVYFFEDKPLFGLDIGHGELRVVQLSLSKSKKPRLKGYGAIAFDSNAVVNGVIIKPELIAHAAVKLFSKELVGEITTNRVAVSLPAYRALTRAVQMPKMTRKDLDEAVRTEASQYMTNPDTLYLDYSILREDKDGIEVFIVGMPKEVVDSYLLLSRMMGLEAVLFDTTIGASAHLFASDKQRSDIPSVLVDVGSATTDITVFNRGLVVTGTVASGGDDITVAIARGLHVTPSEALMLKSEYGLLKSVFQDQIVSAVDTPLALLLKEIRRTIRYYEQRYTKDEPIGQVITMGGGANMPGLTEYLTEHLKLPARPFDPSTHIDFGHLRSFFNADRMSYVTAAGLAIASPSEVFA